MSNIADRLIVALDVSSYDKAERVVGRLGGEIKWFKIGSQLYTCAGPAVVEMVKAAGCKVFLDLKYHDIPATVSRAAVAAAGLRVDMLNVHALGGRRMLEASVNSVEEYCGREKLAKPIMIAVTILTSMDAEDLKEIGLEKHPADMVGRLAAMAKEAGLAGVVASPEEVAAIKEKLGAEFIVVTPGVRPGWAARDDQKRVKTPAEAIRAGSDYIVIGRPILGAGDPREAVKKTLEEIDSVA